MYYRASSTFDFTAMSANSGGPPPWIFDSGTTHHMTFNYFVFTRYFPIFTPTHIYTANNTPLEVTQYGNTTLTSDSSGRMTLPSIYCIPKFTMKLLFVGKITDHNCYILFAHSSFIVQDHTGQKIRAGHRINMQY